MALNGSDLISRFCQFFLTVGFVTVPKGRLLWPDLGDCDKTSVKM